MAWPPKPDVPARPRRCAMKSVGKWCAPITRTIRNIQSEVELGPEHGLPEACVISCDNVITVPLQDLDNEPVGHLDEVTRAALDRALRYALDIVY